MFKIDESEVDLSAEVICLNGETEILKGKPPTSKVFFDKLSAMHAELAQQYGELEVPSGALNAAALVVVYGHDIEWYRARFNDNTLIRLHKFLVGELLEAKKK